jgi:PKHD-type hydroxylase
MKEPNFHEDRLVLTPYNESPPKSNWNSFYYFKNVFNDEMIKDLNDMVSANYKFEKGRTGISELGDDTDSYKTNNRDIAYITPQPYNQWLYELLFPLALEANKDLFHFDIDIVTDPIHYVVYPEDGGHLDWHMDVGAYGVNRRKLAMTVQLSDSDDYEGGDFEIWLGGDKANTVPREKGDVIIFPAFCMHRVKPITRGERRCLVFWTGGRPFR